VAPLDITARETGLARRQRILADNVDERPTGLQSGHPSLLLSIPFKQYANHFKIADLNIFTDGSKTSAHVGSAFVACDRLDRHVSTRYTRLAMDCTVFQAELLAIQGGLEFARDQPPPIASVSIISDSRSSLEAIKAHRSGNSLVLSIKRLTQLLRSRGTVVSFYWCRAHVGYAGNEAADQAAKNAASSPVTYDRLPPSLFAARKREAIRRAFATEPVVIADGLILQLWPSTEARLKDRYVPRWKYLHHFLTGHGPFRTRIHRYRATPACSCGLGEHTADHVLNACEHAAHARQTILALAHARPGEQCGPAVLRLFKRTPGKFQRVNQLLRRLQELSRPTYDAEGFRPP
jgi:ribonuclease HI